MPPADETPGFHEVLKDGQKREQAFAMMNPQWLSDVSDEELAAIVKGYVQSQHQSSDYWKIVELLKTDRERLTPLFIQTVLEPGSESRAPGFAKDILFETPLKRALIYLSPGIQPEILPRLLALSQSEDQFVRRDIATHLAAFGSDEVIASVISFLSDPNSSEASSAMRGIHISLKEGRATPKFRSAIYEPVAKLNRSGMMFGNTQGDLLLALDPERGRRVLMELLEANDLTSHNALSALNRGRIPVSADTLLKILAANQDPSTKEVWRCRFYGSALMALARQKHPAARIEIDRILAVQHRPAKTSRRSENVLLRQQEEASNALLAWEDFQIPELWDHYYKLGRAEVSQVERDLLSMADGEISNGGFSQYFFNIDYDPREDVETLNRLGAFEHAAILKKSFKAFGWWGPNRDRDERMEQLERMSESNSEILGQCDEAWFSSAESLAILTNLYSLKHRAELEAIAVTQSGK